jgi:hypothetical protein
MIGDAVAIQQTVTGFVAGTVYALGFYAATEGPGSIFAGELLSVALFGATNVARSYLLPPASTGPNNTVLFNYYEILFVPASDGAITFRLGNPNPNPAAAPIGVTLDNVRVALVPEIASTALLLAAACGAILLVRRILSMRRGPAA